MNLTIDELIQHIRKTLPQPQAIQHLKPNEEGSFVTFQWNSRQFLVRPSLQVLEVKGASVFVTGASSLMESALLVNDRNQKILETIVETLRQAEGMVMNALRREQGLKLLQIVKANLANLAGTEIKRPVGQPSLAMARNSAGR